MAKWTFLASLLVMLVLAAIFPLGISATPGGAERAAANGTAAQMPNSLAGGGAQGTNPFSDAWLAANHALYDNIWTAEYEGRHQPTGAPGNSTDPFSRLFTPLSDVRMSNPGFNTQQNEFQIDINPTNSQYAIGTSNDYMAAGVGIYRTSNGGSSWTAIDAPVGTLACCDPGVAYAYDGSVYVIVLDTSPFVTYIIRSTDNGATWSAPSAVQTNDRPNIVVDNGASSPRRGWVYLTYTDENASNRIKGYTSTDNGQSWSSTYFVGDVIGPNGFEQGSQPRVASDGTLYVGYQQYTDINAGCAAGVQNTVAKSTDGGATWAYTVMPIRQGGVCTSTQNGRGLFCYSATGAFRSRSSPILGINPTNPQRVYMIYSGGDLEDPYTCVSLSGYHSDILFRMSTDGGATFSAPSKINTDPSGNDQYYPWMTVTPNGTLWVGWHDRREDPNNFRHRWYESYSTDEGTTWRKLDGSLGNEPIAGVTSLPFSFIGDYAGLGAADDRVLPMWWDSRVKVTGDPFTAIPPFDTPTPTSTPTAQSVATTTATATQVPSPTEVPSSTATSTPFPTSTERSDATSSPTRTSTAVPTLATSTVTSTATATACTITFTDVPATDPFYTFIRCLACRGIISGYADGTFRPGNNVTRGQLSKIVSNAAAFNDVIPQSQQRFTDVPHDNPFWLWIERMVAHNVIGGYPCGGPNEPCDSQNRPYFRWGANATRGQISKIVSEARGFTDEIPPTQQTFTDVPPSPANPFWLWIERLTLHGVMSGYQCGGPGEPCDPQNRPYFRWYNDATRGQTSKIVANSFFPGCQTPLRR
jgi:hypothetical protein